MNDRRGSEQYHWMNSMGVRVRALARNPHTAGLPPHVDVVREDLTLAETLDECLDGIDAVFLVWCAPPAAVTPALERIVRHTRRIVFLSSPHKTAHRQDPYYRNRDGYIDDRYSRQRAYGYGRNQQFLIDRVMTDLNRAAERARLDGHERKHFDEVAGNLQEFEARWARGRFDTGKLDRAIHSLEHLAEADRVALLWYKNLACQAGWGRQSCLRPPFGAAFARCAEKPPERRLRPGLAAPRF